jgi:hypothetical protein
MSINNNGSILANFPIAPVLQPNEVLAGSVLIFDADGNQQSDIVIQTSLGQIFAFNPAAQRLTGFPFTAGGMVNSTPAAYDIDKDGQTELFALTNGGELFSWQLDSDFNSELIWWSQSGFQPSGNRYVARQLVPIGLPATELMPQKRAYVYPNPNVYGYTHIRYYLRESAQVDIKVFDLAGDLVDAFSGPGTGMTDNEVRWNLDGISSGVYLCRIEANAGDDNSVQIIKIMVIK